MSACLKGYFHEEFVSTPKNPHANWAGASLCITCHTVLLCVHVHVCATSVGLGIPTNKVSLFEYWKTIAT